MSFFRNIRSSITRGKSSSRDTTPVRTASGTSSRPGSIVSNSTSSIAEERRDSLDSRADSVLNRGETFILGGSDHDDKSQSNSSTLEKKSKKSKVLSKFSTFTKRKKTPQPQTETTAYEHHPSDSATNTYYKWNSDASSNVDYDAQSDPFNFLYEQHSNLKLLQKGIDSADARNAASAAALTVAGAGTAGTPTKNHGFFDSSTYRKGKATSQLKAQLEQLKTQNSATADLCEEEPEADSDKYKTITLNSFRKSFRDKYLQQQKEAPYNPAWFVEVDPVPASKAAKAISDQDFKENRPDYIVFENENYRPGSRSPVRDHNSQAEGRKSRSTTRSPVKRNETFRVERSALDGTIPQVTPSIRVEIKNSVMPQITGRIVPVGVAKPMPMNQTNISTYRPMTARTSTALPSTAITATSHTKGSHSPQRSTYKSPPIIQPAMPGERAGRFQTYIQISGDHAHAHAPKLSSSPHFNRRNRSTSTRIQLGSSGGGHNNNNTNNNNSVSSSSTIHSSTAPLTQKLNNLAGSRYSYAAPAQTTTPSTGLSTYELLKNPIAKPRRLKHTYFGGDMLNANSALPTHRTMPSPATPYVPTYTPTTTRIVLNGLNSNSNYGAGGSGSALTNGNKLRLPSSTSASHSPKRTPSTLTTTTTAGIGGPASASPSAAGFMTRRDQHQSRYIVPVQRRSRSPIKIPWR